MNYNVYAKSKTLLLAVMVILLGTSSVMAQSRDLYVSPQGNDDIDYASVTINTPWRTLNHAIYNLREGDTLFVRGGTYVPKYKMLMRSDYTSRTYGGDPNESMNAESGTATGKIRINGYPGERAIVDLELVKDFMILDNKSFWVFEDLQFINGRTVFTIGYDEAANFNEFRRLTFNARYGGDNSAAIKISSDLGEGTIIENCIIKGPGNTPDIHGNTGGIFARRVNKLTIRNNEISNAPFGIYFKHANSPRTSDYSDVSIIIENNFIHSTSRRAIETNSNGAIIRNNILGPSSSGIRNNEANGTPGGDGNSYEHNTFYSGSLSLSADTQSGDPLPGSLGNRLIGNIFPTKIALHRYAALPHNTSSDFNLYASAITHIENRTEYSLAEWVANADQDRNSKNASTKYSGSDMYEPLSYKLSDDSVGKGMVQGRDAGADASLVGPSIEPTTRPAPPNLN